MRIQLQSLLLLLLMVFITPLPAQNEAATNTAEGAEETVILQFPNADVKALLAMYEDISGRKVLYDSSVNGQVPIYINSPVPKSEAIKIIETSLFLNGFFIVPSERDDIVKVLGPGKPTRSASIPIYSEVSQIPEGEMIISYIFKLQYADPTELQNTLNQYLSTGQPYTSFLALPKTQALLVTESSSTIRNLLGLIESIDTPPAEVVSEFIQLRRADATKVVEYLNQIFQLKEQQQNASAPVAPAPGQPNRRRVVPDEVPSPPEGISPEAIAGFLSEDAVIVGKIKITADTRTNRIHVVTRPVNLPFVRGLITEFDANVEIGQPVSRPLRYVSAGDILPILVATLKEPGIETQEAQGGGGAGTPPSGTTSSRGFTGSGSNSSSSSGEGSSSSVDLNSGLDTQTVDTRPEAVTIGSTRLIADKRANAIIIMGNEEAREKIMRVIDEIDVRSPQVMISAVIGELTLTKGQEFGFDYLLRYFELGNFAGAGLLRNTVVPLLNPRGLTSPDRFAGRVNTPDDNGSTGTGASQGNLAANGGFSGVFTVADSLDIIVRALESTDRFRVTSRPMIYTSNNKPATIASGVEVAVPVSSLTSLENNSTPVTSSSIQYKKIQIKLNVLPLINSDNEVTLDIEQSVDSLAGNTIIDNNQIPRIASRGLKTSVRVPNRATVVLGGLIQEENGRSQGGVPILSQIPGIGLLFSNTAKNKNRTELIILIRPVVIHGEDEMIVNRHVEEQRLYLPPNLEDGLTPELPVETKKSLWWQKGSKDVLDVAPSPTPSRMLKTPRYRN